MPQSRADALARGITRPVATKVCSKCGWLKSRSQFPTQAGRTDGLGSWCRTCVSIRARAIRYGLDFDFVAAELARWPRDGCGICESSAGTPHFDHDHTDGTYRGLLCHRCNIGIAILDRRDDLMKRALEYLK